MILIKSAHITGFRSLQNCDVATLGHLTALVGKNSSGKSNILRALNLFFNGEIQPGVPIQFNRDLFERPKRRQKKRIAITVAFELPASFKFRKQQSYLAELGRELSITRVWELDPQRAVISRFVVTRKGKELEDSHEAAVAFLSVIRFRYIPNRTVPADILHQESQALAGSIFLRMKDHNHADGLMRALTKAAGSMLTDAASALDATGSPLTGPMVATRDLSEMLSMSGFQARGSHGGMVKDEDWGSGHQGFFLYHVLHALDTDYSRFFGWRQATIWAVEEPESALHRELEARLAAQFREWTQDDNNRLQVLFTSHSSIFTMAADDGYWVSLEDGATEIQGQSVPELSRSAETAGVSGWTPPVLSHPWNPVVLVEGHIDSEVLTHVSRIGGAPQLRFLPLPKLDDGETASGKDALREYVRRHAALLQHRQPEAPLIVLFDWEVADAELTRTQGYYGRGGTDLVIRMNQLHCELDLGSDFKGIERFYPPRVFHEAHAAGELILGTAAGRPCSISAGQLTAAKGRLLQRMRAITDLAELRPLLAVVRDVEAASRSQLALQRELAV